MKLAGVIFLLFWSSTLWAKQPHLLFPLDTTSLIQDPFFQLGVGLKGNNSGAPAFYDQLKPFGGSQKPVWELAQWGSRFLLHQNSIDKNYRKGISYRNEGKVITFKKEGKGITVALEVIGGKEYLQARKEGEEWPHLLMEQRFAKPTKVDSLKGLLFQIEAQLVYAANRMSPETWNQGLHTAQITFYLSIQNQNPNSKGYGDFIWFGIPLYDYRNRMLPPYKAQDVGKSDATGKYIYSLGSSDLSTESLHDKRWVAIKKDVYPHIRNAFAEAREAGYLQNTEWEDLQITTLNLGWEMPGTFDARIQYRNLELKAISLP